MSDFVRRFGQRHADGTYYFSNVRSGLIVALLSIGTLFGALIAAPIADRVGRRYSISFWSTIVCVGIIVQISSTDKWYQIMMGRFVAGLGVGALSLLVPMYQVCGELLLVSMRKLTLDRLRPHLDTFVAHSSLHISS
jgi:SP family sugar:H+ symporter-like MFS transporter